MGAKAPLRRRPVQVREKRMQPCLRNMYGRNIYTGENNVHSDRASWKPGGIYIHVYIELTSTIEVQLTHKHGLNYREWMFSFAPSLSSPPG